MSKWKYESKEPTLERVVNGRDISYRLNNSPFTYNDPVRAEYMFNHYVLKD